MNRFLLIIISTGITLGHVTANAAVISRDWKTPGDGLLTYDDVNQREWLDLSQSILSSQFPGEDPSPHITRENRYQYVVGQTSVGGLFEGFAIGQSSDMRNLVESAGINTALLGPPNSIAALQLGQLLGFTFQLGGANLAIGLLNEPLSGQTGVPIRPAAQIDATVNQAGLVVGTFHFQLPTPPGVMLYRNVPECRAELSMLFVLALVLIDARKARKTCRNYVSSF